MNNNAKTDMDMTLDPPGSIAIVGAGTHGIEAGLYGRFLGYDVKILERGAIGNNMRNETPIATRRDIASARRFFFRKGSSRRIFCFRKGPPRTNH